MFLFAEENLVPEPVLVRIVDELGLDRDYLTGRLEDNKRPVNLDQFTLPFQDTQ